MSMLNRKRKAAHFSTISEDMEIRGDIAFVEALDVHGKIVGNVSGGTEDSELALREQAEVQGNVHVSVISINGTVNGNVCGGRIELAANAFILGDIHYNVLEMAQGAKVSGQMIHIDEFKPNGIAEPSASEEPSAGKVPLAKGSVAEKKSESLSEASIAAAALKV